MTEPGPDFIGATLKLAQFLAAFSSDEADTFGEFQFSNDREYILLFQRSFTGIGWQEAIVFYECHDMVYFIPRLRDHQPADTYIRIEGSMGERETTMFLTHFGQVFERSVLLIEFSIPAANFDLTQLWVLKWFPIDKGRSLHYFIVPFHQL